MTSQEAKGSFMLLSDVMKYFEDNNHDSDNLWELIEVDGRSYLPTSVISSRMSEQEWRTMQSKVTTSIFGLNSITI